jgi:hypothetical protein
MTTQNSHEGHPSAAQGAIALNRFHGIFRAGRQVAACRGQKRRNHPFVRTKQLQDDELGALAHNCLPKPPSKPLAVFPGLLRIACRPLRIFFPQLLLDDGKSLVHFLDHASEVGSQHRFLRVDDDIRRGRVLRARQPHCFAQASLHTIALNCAAKSAANRKSNAQPLRRRFARRGNFRPRSAFFLPPRQIKNCHARRKVTPALLIHAFEIRVAQKPRRLRERFCIG